MSQLENLKVKRNLTALVEFSKVINSSLDTDFILNNVLLTCLGKFLATRGLIALNHKGKLMLRSAKGIEEEKLKSFPSVNVNGTITESEELKNFMEETNLQAVEIIEVSGAKLGIVCLGEKLNKAPYSEDDMEFLKTILNIAATAIQNSLIVQELKIVNRSLDSKVQKLNSLFELSKEFGLFSESSKVARLLVYSLLGQFLVSKFAVITFNESEPEILESKFPEQDLKKVLSAENIFRIQNSLRSDEINKNFPGLASLQIELVVPMEIQGRTKGLILLGNRINNKQYSDSDIEYIYSVGSLAIISLENKRLFKEALEKQKMEEELEIARDIQQNLLPHTVPEYSNFDIAAINISSRQVGGDYYDIISLDENNFCVAVADVSGKGVPASLLMANLQAFLRIICKQGMKLDAATELINNLITENTTGGKFITFFWALADNANKTIEYVNAGHNPPLLIRDRKIRKLELGGMILGVMKSMIPYQKELIQLQKDDLLVLFTDGVSEAMNTAGEQYSDERLEELAVNNSGKSASEILEIIKSDVQNFAAGTVQSDDVTLLVIKVK